MPPKPQIAVVVLQPEADAGVHQAAEDLINTLADPEHRYHERDTLVAGERLDVLLQRPGHARACAVLVVSCRSGVDLDVRLTALQARRDGAHRFILVLAEHPGADHTDAVERDARALLESLGLDGNDTPVVRAPLHQTHPWIYEWPPEVLDAVRAALDDLPPQLAPDPLRTALPDLAAETAVLDALDLVVATATILERVPFDPAETATLHHGSGGSYLGGVPYLEQHEPWPQCPGCNRPMPGTLQIDSRDARHGAPPSHGLFVVFICRACSTHEVRHHADPQAARRRQGPPEATSRDHALLRPTLLRRQLPEFDILEDEHLELVAVLRAHVDANLAVAEHRVRRLLGIVEPDDPHLGGHHESSLGRQRTPHCDVCHAPCALVAQIPLEVGHHHALWACRDHPSASHYANHL